MVHDLIANATGQPHWALREEEAMLVGNATSKFLTAFKVPITEKQEAATALIMACGAVYGPRLYQSVNPPKAKGPVASVHTVGAPQQPQMNSGLQ